MRSKIPGGSLPLQTHAAGTEMNSPLSTWGRKRWTVSPCRLIIKSDRQRRQRENAVILLIESGGYYKLGENNGRTKYGLLWVTDNWSAYTFTLSAHSANLPH